MKYPTIPTSPLQQLAETYLATGSCNTNLATLWIGHGETIDIQFIPELGRALDEAVAKAQASDNKDRDVFEGAASGVVHASLRTLPVSVLDDPGFWRYVTMACGLGFATWRERSAFDTHDFSKYRVYIDGSKPAECVLLRMFLRGQISLSGDDYDLASAVDRGADFWRSHVLRVRTGTVPVVARAFVREQAARRMSTGPLRDYARRMNRISSNVMLQDYSEVEAEELVSELRNDD